MMESSSLVQREASENKIISLFQAVDMEVNWKQLQVAIWATAGG